jgi:hypothetical protein
MSAGCGSACQPYVWRRDDPRAAPIPLEDSQPYREEPWPLIWKEEATAGNRQQEPYTDIFIISAGIWDFTRRTGLRDNAPGTGAVAAACRFAAYTVN